jgi:excisionase family DNA binding protein
MQVQMEQLIDPELAGKILGIKTITVYKWVSERKIPFVKVGGALRFRPSALRDWLRECEYIPVKKGKLKDDGERR